MTKDILSLGLAAKVLCIWLIAIGNCITQAFKFGVYVAIPICLTAFVVFRPDNLKAIIDNVRVLGWMISI